MPADKNEFTKLLNQEFGLELTRYVKCGKNVYEVSGSIHGLITVHISNKVRLFWGLAENVLQRLNTQPLPWAAVLLSRNNENGYVWPSEILIQGIAAGRWSIQEKGGLHLKVMANSLKDSEGSFPFGSRNECVDILQQIFNQNH
jgi:hypothetical protein